MKDELPVGARPFLMATSHPDRRAQLLRYWTWSLSLVALALPVLTWQMQAQPKAVAWAEAQEDLFALGPRFQSALESARTELILGLDALKPEFHSSLGREDQLLDRPERLVPLAIDAQVSESVAGRWYFEGIRRSADAASALEALESGAATLLESEQALRLQIDLQRALILARLDREAEALQLLQTWAEPLDPSWTLKGRPAGLVLAYRLADLHAALGDTKQEAQTLAAIRHALLDGRWPMDLETMQLEISFLAPEEEGGSVAEAYHLQQRLFALPDAVAAPGLDVNDGSLLLVDDGERQAALFQKVDVETWLMEFLGRQLPEAAPFHLTSFQAIAIDPTLPSLPIDLSAFLMPNLQIYLPDLDAYVAPMERRRLITLLGVMALSAILLSLTWFGRRLLQREAALQRTRTEFLAGVSHELRTPAASLAMLSDNLLEGRVEGKERVQEYYRSMRRDARRLERLVADVLDVTRMERGTFSMERKPTDLKALLECLVEEQAPRLADGGITLECRVEEDLPTLQLDPFAVERAVANLLENIRRYASTGGWACVSARKRPQGGIEVRVEDRGPGIPSAWRERVFSPYERLPQDQATAAGAGLGLALVQAVLLAHGGAVRVEHGRDQVGSRFVMEFPADA